MPPLSRRGARSSLCWRDLRQRFMAAAVCRDVSTSRREFVAAAVAAASIAGVARAAETAATQPAPITGPTGSRTLLLVDDHDLLYCAGTRRVLHPLKRHASNPLIRGKEKA